MSTNKQKELVVKITIKDGVATVTKQPKGVEIIISDRDSGEEDHWSEGNMYQRDLLK